MATQIVSYPASLMAGIAEDSEYVDSENENLSEEDYFDAGGKRKEAEGRSDEELI